MIWIVEVKNSDNWKRFMNILRESHSRLILEGATFASIPRKIKDFLFFKRCRFAKINQKND
ncbi:hypothetical protein FHS16_005294 [Paenibacillus endophyticus]|uniref:Uncharacterized protein n=1 Tax=Paenibacillus endophyticus TaxID=1294268 RepID=A0A7W5GCS4_9BACL|nr:hypothetical protein [Paenibacillus endophyticus]